MDEREKWNLLHEIVCAYINDPKIEYSKRESASKEIIPYIEQFEPKENGKIVPVFEAKVFNTPCGFKPCDVVYSFENDDAFPALFIMPDDYKGEMDFKPKCLMINSGCGFIQCEPEVLTHEPGYTYRYATDEEKILIKRCKY